MRIVFIPPSEDDFKSLFLSVPLHKGGGLSDINVFQPRHHTISPRTRKGGGIFSFLARRVLPFIIKAAKPSAKTFATSVLKDAISGDTPIKHSIKKHGIKALRETGIKMLSGSGRITKKKKKRRSNLVLKTLPTRIKKKKYSAGRYKKDIFDIIWLVYVQPLLEQHLPSRD